MNLIIDMENTSTIKKDKPKTDILLNGDCLELHLEVPRFKKENMSISVREESILIIKGEIQNEKSNVKKFDRSFFIPNEFDTNNINANLVNGVLTIKINKKQSINKIISIN